MTIKTKERLHVALAQAVGTTLVVMLCIIYAPNPQPPAIAPKQAVAATNSIQIYCGSPKQRRVGTVNMDNIRIGQIHATNYGWTGREWDALVELWTCESNWNHLAGNPSGAYGIAQFMPATWASYGCVKTSDPDLQIRCGLKYVLARYGVPSKALAKHYSSNWY